MRLKKLIRNLMSRLRTSKRHNDTVPVTASETEDTKRRRRFSKKSLRKFISKRQELPRYRKFDSESANPTKKSVRFASVASNNDNEETNIHASSSDSETGKKAKKRKRLRYLKRQARKAVEYLAVGIAASGAGYGMPAGFNPTAFRSECTVYPEVYTLEQLRWMSNYKKNLYSIGHLAT